MDFVWDEQENESNIQKHGLDFIDAHKIFSSPILEARDERQDYGDDRWIGIGLLEGRTVVVVFAEPTENTVRIISLRKALRRERERFEQHIQAQLGGD